MREKFWQWLAWYLPHDLAKFAFIRVFAHATQGDYSREDVVAVTAMDALRRWEAEA